MVEGVEVKRRRWLRYGHGTLAFNLHRQGTAKARRSGLVRSLILGLDGSIHEYGNEDCDTQVASLTTEIHDGYGHSNAKPVKR